MATIDDRIEIMENRTTKWFVFAIGIALVSGSLLLLAVDRKPVLAVTTLLFFGYLSFKSFSAAMDSRPSMIFDRNGITNRDGRMGLIEWQDIEYASLRKVEGQMYIHLHMYEEEKYRTRLGHTSRRIRIVKKVLGHSPFIIPTVTLKMKPEELLALINERIGPYPFD